MQSYEFISLFFFSFLIRADFSCSVRISVLDTIPLFPSLLSLFPLRVFVHKIIFIGSQLTVLLFGFYEHKFWGHLLVIVFCFLVFFLESLKFYLSVLKENVKTISAALILFKPNLMSLLPPPNEINSRTASIGCCLCILTPQEKRIYFSAAIVVTINIYLVA